MSDKKICAECGEEFESDRKNGRFCSEKCRRRYNSRKQHAKYRSEPYMHTVVCRECGKKFQHKTGSIRYCSAECRSAADRARRQERDSARQKREEQHNRDVRETMARLARKSTVAKVNAAGRAQGLSYGQMMARKDGYYGG